MDATTNPKTQMLIDAARYLQAAIEKLDDAGAPGQIAAHLDLALHQLTDVLSDANIATLQRANANDDDCGTARTS